MRSPRAVAGASPPPRGGLADRRGRCPPPTVPLYVPSPRRFDSGWRRRPRASGSGRSPVAIGSPRWWLS